MHTVSSPQCSPCLTWCQPPSSTFSILTCLCNKHILVNMCLASCNWQCWTAVAEQQSHCMHSTISCTARPQTLLAGMSERLSIRRYMTQRGSLLQIRFCKPCTHCAIPCRPHGSARDSHKHPRSRQIHILATAQPGVGEDSAHQDEYFGQMGRRSRKTRKREMHNLPGRGFPHKAEDAHEAVFLALAQTTSVMALALGSTLTIYKPGYAHHPCRSSLCLVTELPHRAAVSKAPMLCSPPAVMWDLTMQHAPPSLCTPSFRCSVHAALHANLLSAIGNDVQVCRGPAGQLGTCATKPQQRACHHQRPGP